MINHDRWIKSLTIKNNKIDNEANQLDHDRWTNTIPQKNPVKKVTNENPFNILKDLNLD